MPKITSQEGYKGYLVDYLNAHLPKHLRTYHPGDEEVIYEFHIIPRYEDLSQLIPLWMRPVYARVSRHFNPDALEIVDPQYQELFLKLAREYEIYKGGNTQVEVEMSNS